MVKRYKRRVRDKLEMIGNCREDVVAGFISEMINMDYTGQFIGKRVAFLLEVLDRELDSK